MNAEIFERSLNSREKIIVIIKIKLFFFLLQKMDFYSTGLFKLVTFFLIIIIKKKNFDILKVKI